MMETLPREVVSVSKYEIEPFKHGRRVGCYLLGKTLGEGSFAKVKEGLHIITGEKVAVKIIDKKRAREDRYISKNLRREARIHQLVRHPNIIQLYEVLETDNYYYLVMEYCDAGELLDYICTRKRLDENVAKRLVSQLVSAVDGMHNSGVVHRDLKIENFLLNENEDLKIIDFGLSNTLSQGCMEEYERTGVFPQFLNTHCGSPAYAAPELLAQKKYGPQVDVWSIGINMYAMLTGFLPYMMEPFNVMEMYEKMMQRKMTPVPSFLSQACRDLLMRLLEPVAEWRITLKQVMKHKWFTASEHIPRSIPLGDMMYQKKELCEPVLAYMKYTLRIRTKDAINAVVSNKAVHASAVYHLLVTRLDRYLKHKKDKKLANQFAKLEIIKKSSLSTENVHAASTNNRSKRFTFRGKKIDSTSRSQPNLAMEDVDGHIIDLITQNQIEKINNNEYNEEDKKTNSSNSLENITESSIIRQPRGHKRSNSSVNSKGYRKSNEVKESIRKSLISDSQDDLGKFTENHNKSPKDPFPKHDKEIVTRKQSCEVGGIDVLVSLNGDKIDVTKFIESPRKNSSDKTQVNRKISLDVFDNKESKTREEQKEPAPGWHITKVVKQPPLKEPEKKMNGLVTPEPNNECKKMVIQTISDSEANKTKRTVPDSKGELIKSMSSDLNNNNLTEDSFPIVSDSVRKFKEKEKDNENRSHTPEVEEILRNVRTINREHLTQEKRRQIGKIMDIDRLLSTPETGEKWKPPDRETIENIHDSQTRIRKVTYISDSDSTISNTPSPPFVKEVDYATDGSEIYEENNNDDTITVRTERSISIDRGVEQPNISPIKTITISKKTLELNVKQFTQFKQDSITSPIDDKQTTTTHHHTQLKPLQLKFNFQVRKKRAYKEKQQTRSLTEISQGVNAKPTEEQMLAPKHRCNEKCHVNGQCTEKHDLGYNTIYNPTQRRNVRKTMSSGDAKTTKRTTIKISSRKNSNVGNSRANRTKVYIASSSRSNTVDDSNINSTKHEIHEELGSKNSSFDSGYFGINPSPTINDDTHHHHSNSDTVNSNLRRSNSWNYKNQPLEIHSVKYRCIPVYQPEIVKTGTLHSKGSLSVISEDEKPLPIHKKWGSQTIEPTQEPIGHVPRSAVLVNNIKEKFRKEREKKMESIKRDSLNSYSKPKNRIPSKEFKHVRTFSNKQYPIEKTIVGPQIHRINKNATFGHVNDSLGSTTKTPRNSPKVYDSKIEKNKVIAFAYALENAACRKKTVV